MHISKGKITIKGHPMTLRPSVHKKYSAAKGYFSFTYNKYTYYVRFLQRGLRIFGLNCKMVGRYVVPGLIKKPTGNNRK